MQNINDIVIVPTNTSTPARPAFGEEWKLHKFGSDVWGGAGAPDDTPRMNVGFDDGVVATPAWFLRSTHVRGWNHKPDVYISRGVFVTLNNPVAGGDQNLSFSGEKVREFGVGPLQVVTDVETVGPAGVMIVRPPVDEEWLVTEFGASEWVGAAPNGLPEITVSLTDGVSTAIVCQSADPRGWFTELELYITNALWLTITNDDGGNPNVIGYSGIKLQQNASGLPNVMSAIITDAIGGGTLIARPAAPDEEWIVTMIAASVWVAIPGGLLPDLDVNMTDGILTSLLARNSDLAFWVSNPRIPISRDHWLTLTDTGGAGGDIAFSAIRSRLL